MKIAINPEDFLEMLNEYFGENNHRQRMTKEEIEKISIKLNQEIDIPIVSETQEQKVLFKIVLKIDNFIYEHLPNEIYDLIRDLKKGISDKEVKKLTKRLTKLANDKIDIPYIPEFIEGKVMRFIIKLIINGIRKNSNLDHSIETIKIEP